MIIGMVDTVDTVDMAATVGTAVVDTTAAMVVADIGN